MLDIKDFLECVEQQQLDVYQLVVYQDGEKTAEKLWHPVQRRNQYSVTKSFTSTAVGFALAEGLFTLEDRVVDHFSSDLPQEVSPLLEEMRLKHLLTMTMGFREQMLMGIQRPAMVEKDWVRFVLKGEMAFHPGEKFLYNNAGPHLLGVLIQRITGQSLISYLTPRLFQPLGYPPITQYEQTPDGYTFGAGGLYLDVYELARFGLLYLQKGCWNGKQILPLGWAEEAGRSRTYSTGDNTTGYTYGYLFWVGPNEKWFYANGKYEQLCVIVPDKKAVVTVNCDEKRPGDLVMHALARTILPRL